MVYLNAPYGGEWRALYGRGKRLFTKGFVVQPEGPRLDEVRTWLEATKNRGMALGLKHTKEALYRLNLDHTPPHVLHVAGSNGKGTVCALMAASLTLSNQSNLFFSSPHLVRVEERLRLNGVPIEAERLDAALKAVHHASQIEPAIPLTFFEVTYLSAMQVASDAHVEVLILETGLGGRLDATRSGPATASLITAISGEHRDILGDSIAQIAKEKAAIARPGCPILIRKPLDEATEKAMLEEASMAGQSELGEQVEPAHARLVAIPLTAPVRSEALILAKALFEEVGLVHTELETAFEQLQWPARLQHLSQASTGSHSFILDAAHNPSGLERVLPELEHCIKDAIQSKKGWTLLLGTSPQEDLASFCAPLMALCERHPPRQVVFTEPQGGRYPGVACESLASLPWPYSPAFAAPLPTDALHYLSTQVASEVGLVVSLGSLYLQGNLLEAFGLSSDEHLSLLSKD